MNIRWEYCELFQSESTGSRLGFTTGKLIHRVFGKDGYVVDEKVGDAGDDELLGMMVAELGLEGWELVGFATALKPGVSASGVKYLFKKPIPYYRN